MKQKLKTATPTPAPTTQRYMLVYNLDKTHIGTPADAPDVTMFYGEDWARVGLANTIGRAFIYDTVAGMTIAYKKWEGE